MEKTAVVGTLHLLLNDFTNKGGKANQIYKGLKPLIPTDKLFYADIWGGKKRIVPVVIDIIKAFRKCHNIILISSSYRGPFTYLISRLQKKYKNNVIYIAVGVKIGQHLIDEPNKSKNLNYVHKFLVETNGCVSDMQKAGFSNVQLFRNFKSFSRNAEFTPHIKTEQKSLKFCTFSRVLEQKGITDAIRAIEEVSKERPEANIKLDIYGPIDESYKEKFYELLKNNKEIQYRGTVDGSKSVNILGAYDCMLFPTKFIDEGIPSSLIDAFGSGLPIISSKWIYFSEVLEDGYTAIGYDFGSFEGLKESILKVVDDPDLLENLSRNCWNEYLKYDVNTVMPDLVNLLE